MGHSWKTYLTIIGLSLAAIAINNKVKFINNLTGTNTI